MQEYFFVRILFLEKFVIKTGFLIDRFFMFLIPLLVVHYQKGITLVWSGFTCILIGSLELPENFLYLISPYILPLIAFLLFAPNEVNNERLVVADSLD